MFKNEFEKEIFLNALNGLCADPQVNPAEAVIHAWDVIESFRKFEEQEAQKRFHQ